MVEVIPLVGLIVCAVALVLDIALSFSPMYWLYNKNEAGGTTGELFVGLWKSCFKTSGGGASSETCTSHDDITFPFDYQFVGAAQVFQCLGFLFILAAIVFVILKMFVLKDKDFLLPLGAAHALWAAISFIGSAGVVGDKAKDYNTATVDYTDYLHFSFAFAVISGLVALVGGIILIVAVVKK